MLMLAFDLPDGGPRGPALLVFILQKENLDRMAQADPFDFQVRTLEGQRGVTLRIDRRIRDLDLVIAYEEDLGVLIDFQERRDIAGLLLWLERGRALRPGDLAPLTPLRKT